MHGAQPHTVAMSLPIKTTVDDVRKVTSYFRSKPTGATVAEAKAVLGTTPVDGRKMRAYLAWEILSQDGDRYKLSDRGRRFAKSPGDEVEVLREIINGVAAYRSAIELAHHQSLTELLSDDLAANWHEHHQSAVETENATTIKNQVNAFFSLAHGAGLGTYRIGRNGALTRLELDRTAVQALVEAGPSAPPWQAEDSKDDAEPERSAAADAMQPESSGEVPDEPEGVSPVAPSSSVLEPELRVFITHGKNMVVVDQVKTTLEIASIKAEVAVEEESTAIPVPDKVFGAMRRCNAGIICVSAEEGADPETLVVNQNVLIEIGAAFVLYDKRVVLLWDKRVPVPSNLQGLYRCEYEGDELSWTTGMKLMKAIQGFKEAL